MVSERVPDEGAEALLARAQRGLGLLLLFAGGPGHPDDEDEDEGAHEAEGLRLGQIEKRRDPALPDAELADGDADQAPEGGDPPGPRAAGGDVLEGHEGVGADDHRPPSGQVDDAGDRGGVEGHPHVEPQARGLAAVERLDEHAHRRACRRRRRCR